MGTFGILQYVRLRAGACWERGVRACWVRQIRPSRISGHTFFTFVKLVVKNARCKTWRKLPC